ncbi:putative reverse transcriptase domain-containing protein, partial [Tanacetum coccineum]
MLPLQMKRVGILEAVPCVRNAPCITQDLAPATGSNQQPVSVICHACGEKGHYANQCRKTTNNNAQGRAYMLRDRNAHQNPNVVTGMFLLNQHLARTPDSHEHLFFMCPFSNDVWNHMKRLAGL